MSRSLTARLLGLAILLLLTVGHLCPASAQSGYFVQDLRTLGGSESAAYAINNAGTVVGYSTASDGLRHAFEFSNGTMRDLGINGVSESYATAINDHGDIAGYTIDAYGVPRYAHPFIWSSGTVTYLPLLPTTYSGAEAFGINSHGQAVGLFFIGEWAHAILWDNWQPKDLNADFGNAPGSAAYAINDSGTVTGLAADMGGTGWAVVWNNGVGMRIAGPGVTGSSLAIATAVNAVGEVVGYAESLNSSPHAFTWASNVLTDIAAVPSYANAVNRSGQAVGRIAGGSNSHAALFMGGQTVDLNGLIPKDAGIELTDATGINDAGQIVGSGITSSGETHAILLTPAQPLLVAFAKLSLPVFDRSTKTFQVTLHLKGVGSGTATGSWLLDGSPYGSSQAFGLDLSSGTWVGGPTLAIPWSVLLGNHTISFALNTPTSDSTQQIEAAVTAFDPAVHGWKFPNAFPPIPGTGAQLFGDADGLCIGMSREARRNYITKAPIPQDWDLPSPAHNAALYYVLLWSQFWGLESLRYVDTRRYAVPYWFDSNAELRGETDRVFSNLKSSLIAHAPTGDPSVLGLFVKPDGNGGGHGVVATSAFYCNDAFTDEPDTEYNVRRFFVYDPNQVGEFRTLDVFNRESQFALTYVVAGAQPLPVHFFFRLTAN